MDVVGARTRVRSEARRASLWLLLVATAGCNFDSAPIGLLKDGHTQRPVLGDQQSQAGQSAAADSGANDGGTAGSSAAGSNAAGNAGAPSNGGSTGSSAGNGGAPPSTVPPGGDPTPADASAPPPSKPDAAGDPPSDAAVPDASEDSGPDPVEPEPPKKGLLFDRCVTDDGCSLGLVCYGSGPGHCAQPCAESSDCVAVDGFEFTCSPDEGACRIDCADDENDDACPMGLVCIARGGGQRRCMLPREEGSGDREIFESCDRAHGDDDCAEGLVCYRSDDSQIDGPGYCTLPCGQRGPGESACDDVPFSSAEFECAGGVCRFDCTDAACPFGMACETLGDRGVCHHPAATP